MQAEPSVTVGLEELDPDDAAVAVKGPPLPMGQRLHLSRRGTIFYREVPGPPGAPTVVLIHGLMASGGLNWFQVFEPLGKHFRVIAPDLRGHGRGIRSGRRFRLKDCADDVAALMAALDIDEAIAVGYSLGGPVAKLLWKRHRERVSGLVLAATGYSFVPGARERTVFVTAMYAAAVGTRVGSVAARVPVAGVRRLNPVRLGRPTNLRDWAAAEMRRHDYTKVLQAAHSIGTFNSDGWLHRIDVPTTVVVTTKDRALPAAGQLRMAEAIPGATVLRLEGGHATCMRPEFATVIVEACQRVAQEAAGRAALAQPLGE